jgi:AraC-like DNA-binding protein
MEIVIQEMRARLDQPLPLEQLAEITGFSPYHFHRLFRSVTGIPPNEYLTVLRLQEAKRLLLATPLSVTDICFNVGYASLGTFTTRFTSLVGLSPSHLRRFTSATTLPTLSQLHEILSTASRDVTSSRAIGGYIHAPYPLSGPIFIGLFPKPLPQGTPCTCTVLTTPGLFHIASPPDGCYYLLATSLPWSPDPLVPTLPQSDLLVGACSEPLHIHHGVSNRHFNISLRPSTPIDLPILSCLPFLLIQRLTQVPTASEKESKIEETEALITC